MLWLERFQTALLRDHNPLAAALGTKEHQSFEQFINVFAPLKLEPSVLGKHSGPSMCWWAGLRFLLSESGKRIPDEDKYEIL